MAIGVEEGMKITVGDIVQFAVGSEVLWEVMNVVIDNDSRRSRLCVLKLFAGTYFVRRTERRSNDSKKCNGMESIAWASKLGAIESDYF